MTGNNNTKEKRININKIIDWTLTTILIILIIWLLIQKTYCNYTITPEQAIQLGKLNITNLTKAGAI